MTWNRNRAAWAIAAVVVGVLIAGFWNYKLVDGLGRDLIASPLIGEEGETITFGERGSIFGFLFAAAAGLAASFTACNCVVFSMLPGLLCPTGSMESTKRSAFKALAVFAAAVLAVCAVYGIYVTSLGTEGVQAFNERGMRISQAQTTFTIIGVVLIVWGLLSYGFLGALTAFVTPRLQSLLASPLTKAAIMGVMAGFFTVGRPYPVFREFIMYAAESGNVLYGSAIMMVQGLAQIAVMALLFLGIIFFFGKSLTRWITEKPHQSQMISSFALLAGGAFFVYYWGFAFWYDIGRWGFKLNWYE